MIRNRLLRVMRELLYTRDILTRKSVVAAKQVLLQNDPQKTVEHLKCSPRGLKMVAVGFNPTINRTASCVSARYAIEPVGLAQVPTHEPS